MNEIILEMKCAFCKKIFPDAQEWHKHFLETHVHKIESKEEE